MIFIKNSCLHVTKKSSRGPLFLNDADYLRFTDYLYHFNTTRNNSLKKTKRLGPRQTEKLVEIICYSLISNQFNLILIENYPGSAKLYLKKVCTGYSMYFNKKYNQKGRLFGECQTAMVSKKDILLGASKYIHLCPLNEFQPKSKNPQQRKAEATIFFRRYPWSSYRAYALSGKNYLVIPRHDLLAMEQNAYQMFVEDFIESIF